MLHLVEQSLVRDELLCFVCWLSGWGPIHYVWLSRRAVGDAQRSMRWDCEAWVTMSKSNRSARSDISSDFNKTV